MHVLKPLTMWLLIASIFVVLIIGFSVWLILFLKARKLRKRIIVENNLQDAKKVAAIERVFNRDKPGDLLWVLKKELNSNVSDHDLEFSINNIVRNNYKKIYLVGEDNEYRAISIAKITQNEVFINQEIALKQAKKYQVVEKIKVIKILKHDDKFDYALIDKNIENLLDLFDSIWSHINKGGLLFIEGFNKKTKRQKKLIQYLKLIGVRYEFNKQDNWFIIIAK